MAHRDAIHTSEKYFVRPLRRSIFHYLSTLLVALIKIISHYFHRSKLPRRRTICYATPYGRNSCRTCRRGDRRVFWCADYKHARNERDCDGAPCGVCCCGGEPRLARALVA